MLTVTDGLAEFEHELIRPRTGEGPKRAKECGGLWGPSKLTTNRRRDGLKSWPTARRPRQTWRGGLT
ncbi:MAG TPA: hypothetical protein VIE66_21210 [Methylocella sp.]|jgi:DNA invertase Pin-like site-specific DNA recombinase